jgi:hypothetical protein
MCQVILKQDGGKIFVSFETPEEALARLTELVRNVRRLTNLIVASLLKEWSGSAWIIQVTDVLSNIEAATKMGNLDKANLRQIVKVEVVVTAVDFLFSRPQLMNIEVPYRYFAQSLNIDLKKPA